uniref:DUF4283 domain-containing protein n=1 Tax=Populus alba TaxID=43335 RepID=A0A4U5QUG5_POPAL|nr:hypothetical protein D5086_0000061640 [Populus alba]
MAKNKRKVTVARRQDPAHFVDPNAHEVDGDGHVAPAFETEGVSCPLGPAPSTMRDSDGDDSVLCDGDGSVAQGPHAVTASSTHVVGPPKKRRLLLREMPPASNTGRQVPAPPLVQFEVWNYCVVGYISGKSTGFKALNSIIANVWKTEATLTIHETGWLIYRFKSEEDKLDVLRGGPYLVYGQPLVLRPMTKFFDFSCEEMSRVPVWVKFPSLPLCCWSLICLSKIASVIGKPIQCDQLTSNLSRMSYARVLVEIDLLEELRHTVEIALPDGPTFIKKWSTRLSPSIAIFATFLTQDDVDRENVFNRLGPQPPLVSSPPTMHGQPHSNINQQAAEEIVTPEVALDNSAGWVTVDSRKASKLRKGKEVAGSGRVPHSPPTPPVSMGTGPPPTAPLLIPCEGVDHNTTPATGTTIGVGNLVNVPPVEVANQCGVRTGNQKQRSRSGRVFPSTAHP